MRKGLVAVIGVFLAGAPALAVAQAKVQPAEADIQCFVVSAALATSNDNRVRGRALISSMYYMGRIDTQAVPPAEVNRRIQAAVRDLNDASMEAKLMACSDTMQTAGNKYRMVGQELRERRPPS